jgi:hypothetical protein
MRRHRLFPTALLAALVLTGGAPRNASTVSQWTAPSSEHLTRIGRYELAPTFAIEVTREGDALFVQATNQPRFRAYAASPTRFFLRVVEAEVEFVRDASGAISGLVLFQGGRETPGRRVGKQAPEEAFHGARRRPPIASTGSPPCRG